MTSTKHDAPDGRRRWLDKRHERCKLPVRASRYARTARYTSASVTTAVKKEQERASRAANIVKKEAGGAATRAVKQEQGVGGVAGAVKKENGKEYVAAKVVKKEVAQGGAAGVVKEEQVEGDGAGVVKKEEGAGGADVDVKKDPEKDGKRREGSSSSAVGVAAETEGDVGETRSTTPSRKRPRTDDGRPSSDQGSSDPKSTNNSDCERQEDDPCSTPPTSRARGNPLTTVKQEEGGMRAAGVGAASPTAVDGGATVATAASTPSASTKTKGARSEVGLEDKGGRISRNLAKSEGWAESSSSTSAPGSPKSGLLLPKIELGFVDQP